MVDQVVFKQDIAITKTTLYEAIKIQSKGKFFVGRFRATAGFPNRNNEYPVTVKFELLIPPGAKRFKMRSDCFNMSHECDGNEIVIIYYNDHFLPYRVTCTVIFKPEQDTTYNSFFYNIVRHFGDESGEKMLIMFGKNAAQVSFELISRLTVFIFRFQFEKCVHFPQLLML